MIPKLKDMVTGKARTNVREINKKANISLSAIKHALKDDDTNKYKTALEIVQKELNQIAKMSKELMK
jgi:hypothetical protein